MSVYYHLVEHYIYIYKNNGLFDDAHKNILEIILEEKLKEINNEKRKNMIKDILYG